MRRALIAQGSFFVVSITARMLPGSPGMSLLVEILLGRLDFFQGVRLAIERAAQGEGCRDCGRHLHAQNLAQRRQGIESLPPQPVGITDRNRAH